MLAELVASRNVGPQLMSDALRSMAAHLNLLNDDRLTFQSACATSLVATVRSYAASASSPMPICAEAAAELYFPTRGLRRPGSVDQTQHIDWLDRQLYSRMATCVAGVKGNPKGELLVRSCSDPDNLPFDHTITLLRFLRSYSATHFMGDLGELIGLPLVTPHFENVV